MAKKWTEAERKAFGEKMKAARQKRNEQATETVAQETAPSQAQTNETGSVTLTQDQFNEMMSRLQKLEEEKRQAAAQPDATPATQVDASGRPIGVNEKFPIDPSLYQSPIEQLFDDPLFARFALRENFMFDWSVHPLRYQNIFGIWQVEPKFELVMSRKLRNSDGSLKLSKEGKPQAAVVGRFVCFEDPPRDMQEAAEAGLSPDDVGTPEFSKKMRYYQYKKFVSERLNPPRPEDNKKRSKEEVIGGRVYEIQEYSELL